jgi:hypothetical protein
MPRTVYCIGVVRKRNSVSGSLVVAIWKRVIGFAFCLVLYGTEHWGLCAVINKAVHTKETMCFLSMLTVNTKKVKNQNKLRPKIWRKLPTPTYTKRKHPNNSKLVAKSKAIDEKTIWRTNISISTIAVLWTMHHPTRTTGCASHLQVEFPKVK